MTLAPVWQNPFFVDRKTSVTIWENSCKHAHSKKGQHLPSPEQPLRLFLGNSDFSFGDPGIFLSGDSNLSFSGGPGFPRKSCSFLTRTTLDIRQDDVRHIVTTKNYFVLFCFVSHFDFSPVLIHGDDNCHHRAHQRRWGALLRCFFFRLQAAHCAWHILCSTLRFVLYMAHCKICFAHCTFCGAQHLLQSQSWLSSALATWKRCQSSSCLVTVM